VGRHHKLSASQPQAPYLPLRGSDQYATLILQHGISSNALKELSLPFDVIADLPEGITVMPVFAADKHEALKAAKELFPGHRVTVVLKEGEPGT
jgi:hypothetical protein